MKNLILKSLLCLSFVLLGMNSFAQGVITWNTSSPSACDGSAQIYDSIYGYTTFTWMQGSTTLPGDSILATGLCTGIYSVTFGGSSTYSDTTITFSIEANSPCTGFFVHIASSQAATPGNCDGVLTPMAQNGTPPYTYSWNNGITGQNFCPGITYTVMAADANGCTSSASGFVIEDTSTAGGPCSNFNAWMNITQPSTLTSCDGSIGIGSMGGASPIYYTWGTSSPTLVGAVSNLCANDSAYVVITDANGCTITLSTTLSAPADTCNGFTTTILVTQQVSDPNTCNGGLTSSMFNGTAPFTYSWSTGSTAPQLFGLCPGTYSLTVTDANGCSSTDFASLYYDTIPHDSLSVYANPNSVSEDGECDGSLQLYASGGYPSYTYSLSNGATNQTGYFDSLCQGIYSVAVYDMAGDTVYFDIVISNPGNTFNNNTYEDSVYVDSIMGDLQANCNLNYQAIDSVYITSYEMWGDSIVVYWAVVSDSGTNTIIQSYTLTSGTGVYTLGLQVYCPGKSLGSYFTATDQIYYGGTLGMQENALDDMLVYPNPVSDILNIQFSQSGKYDAVLYDVMGREILRAHTDSDHLAIPAGTLSKGQYTLKVSGNNGTMSKSIIK